MCAREAKPVQKHPREVRRNFKPIHLASLGTDAIPGFGVYLAVGDRHVPVLYCGEDLPFPDDVRRRLIERGVTQVFIDRQEEPAYRRYLENQLPAILADPCIDVGAKSEILYYSATGLMEEVMADPRSGEFVPRCRDLVSVACRMLMSERIAFTRLVSITSCDYYTYTHSVNVFVFTVALARRLGVTDAKDLQEIGEGALLHDLGKSLIDPKILNWPGKLNPAQWEEMRKHPLLGEEMLIEKGVKSERVLSIVRHHHEKLGGGGYPDALKDRDLPDFARMCAIADIFDALTTRRSYKGALRSYAALDLMCREIAQDLDTDYFRAFVAMMGERAN